MLFKLKGKLIFDPEDKTRKHISQSSWKRVALIKTNCDLDVYYAWFLKKRFNLELNRSLRASHITFINDKVDFKTFDQASRIFNGKEIEFFVENEPRSNGMHWWLRVYSSDAENIRDAIGLDRVPFHPFHLTIGYANEKNIAHSEYILRQCINFGLTSNEKRDFESQEIYEI